MSNLRVVKNEEARIEIAFPEVFTAEMWARFHGAEAKHVIVSPSRTAIMTATYMGALAILAYARYEDIDGNSHDVLTEGLEVPAYVMSWIAIQGRRALDVALEVPKFSSPLP